MASKTILLEKVEELVAPALSQHEAELVDLQFVHEHGRWVLRFFVDKPDRITLDDCAVISEHVGRLLDGADIIPQTYSLEISSPGVNRPLRKESDFKKFIGE